MTKRLIATVLAASLALTSVAATPARAADSGEIGRFLLGAGALFIIGSAIANNDRRHKYNNRSYDSDRYVTRRHVDPRPRVKPRRKVVPSACLRVNRWNNGPRRFFGHRCLSRNMRHVGRLPIACHRKIWTNRGQRSVYHARCLRNHGWVFG
ncbi:MAG: hypothetical protein QNJ44_20510 [Rhodobacter sp.]|nr:hypothetical protein [Rhodobacter sp.]